MPSTRLPFFHTVFVVLLLSSKTVTLAIAPEKEVVEDRLAIAAFEVLDAKSSDGNEFKFQWFAGGAVAGRRTSIALLSLGDFNQIRFDSGEMVAAPAVGIRMTLSETAKVILVRWRAAHKDGSLVLYIQNRPVGILRSKSIPGIINGDGSLFIMLAWEGAKDEEIRAQAKLLDELRAKIP